MIIYGIVQVHTIVLTRFVESVDQAQTVSCPFGDTGGKDGIADLQHGSVLQLSTMGSADPSRL